MYGCTPDGVFVCSQLTSRRRTPERRTIYFLPLGEFEDTASHLFDKLATFARMYVARRGGASVITDSVLMLLFSYFTGMEVKLMPPLKIHGPKESGSLDPLPLVGSCLLMPPHPSSGKLTIDVPRATRRRVYTSCASFPWRVAHPYDLHKARARAIFLSVPDPHRTTLQVKDRDTTRQLHAPPILTSLQHFLPENACCLLAFTMEDLYDGQRVSFSGRQSVAVLPLPLCDDGWHFRHSAGFVRGGAGLTGEPGGPVLVRSL